MKCFDDRGVRHHSSKLYVGDYMSFDNPRLIIDRKQNLNELYQNLCHQHKRFKDELIRANEAGIKLIILIEHGGKIKSLEDVKLWDNPRLEKNPFAWNGMRMYKVMLTTGQKYGIEYVFCTKNKTGEKILEILSEKNQNEVIEHVKLCDNGGTVNARPRA